MIYILLLLFVLLIPFSFRVYAEKFDDISFMINCSLLWNLIRFRYSDDRIPELRISGWVITLEERGEKVKDKRDKEPGLKPAKKKIAEKKSQFKIEDGFEFLRRHFRRCLRILRKVFDIFSLSGYLDSTYSLGNPAWDGISYGYIYPFFQVMTTNRFKTNLFPKFGSADLYFVGKTDITVKTRVWFFLYFLGRSYKDLWILKKEILNGKDRRVIKKD
ncbi:MAG TPA: hypothetical protein ENN73_02785 [Firmicutes bacterium]|nr:hypothetical protein [Bacillota bacterium]